MKRFILVSFAFLGWVFYELSGGADFQPRVAETVPVAAARTASTAPAVKSTPVNATTLVVSPAIAQVEPVPVTSAPATAAPFIPVPVPATIDVAQAAEPDIETAAKLDQIRTSLSQGLSLFSDVDPIAQPLMLASLEQGAAGMSVAPAGDDAAPEPVAVEPVAPPADIREITGTRVNMRDGPGTIYPVISRLTIGHAVEVLDDSGTGWLRLRTMPEKQIGWISASLVSKDKR